MRLFEKLRRNKYFFALFIVLIIAFIIRIWNISSPSIFEDEYNAFIAVQLSCSHPLFISSMYEKHVWFFDHPFLGFYIYELSCIVPSVEFLRVINIIFGIGIIFVTFFIARNIFEEKTALLASIFLSFSIPFITYNRFALLDTFVTFFMVLSFYFFITKNNRLAWFAAGLGFATKFTSVAIIVVFILYYLLTRKFKLIYSTLFIIFVIAFFIGDIGAFFVWDHISPNKGIYTEVPLVVKQIIAALHGSAERGTILDRIVEFTGAFAYQTIFLPIILILFISINYRKYVSQHNTLILLLAIVVTFVIGIAAGSITRYLLYTLPFFFITFSYSFLRFATAYNKYFSIFVLFLFFSYSVYQIVILSPYYNLYGFGIKNSGADITYSSFREETINYINNHTTTSDKILLLGNIYHIKSFIHFKPLKYNIFYKAKETDKVLEAKYAVIGITYKNKDMINKIRSNFVLEKTFGAMNTTFVWIYRNSDYVV